jgi:hypothetical protein
MPYARRKWVSPSDFAAVPRLSAAGPITVRTLVIVLVLDFVAAGLSQIPKLTARARELLIFGRHTDETKQLQEDHAEAQQIKHEHDDEHDHDFPTSESRFKVDRLNTRRALTAQQHHLRRPDAPLLQ